MTGTIHRTDEWRRGLMNLRRQKVEPKKNLILHTAGLSLAVCGAGILASAGVEAIDGGPDTAALLAIGLVATLVGFTVWRLTEVPEKIALLDVFSTVTSVWVSIAVIGALPYVATGTLPALDNALFESVSGFTTTGATVIRPIEEASAGILFWRAITQWLGGMGVIVLVVAVLPAVSMGGMGLLEAEAPGPSGERLTPRVTQTARRLWGLYIGFTAVLALAYLGAGMSIYDAVAHSMTTVSTGGFSPYNDSLGHFDSALIEWLAIVGMFLAGSSFTLLYKLIRGNPKPLIKSVEFRTYCIIVIVAVSVIFIGGEGTAYDAESFRDATFTTLSIVTTTGYATADFGTWSQSAQSILLILMPVGAMAGSTAGGVKVIRVLAIASHAHRETLRQLHPRIVRPVRVGDTVVDERVANKVLGFFVLALATFGGSGLLIALSGADMITAFSASATLFGNVGPGLGDVGPTADFLNIARFGRWVGIVAMLLGRLEIYPILLALVALPLRGPWRVIKGIRSSLR